LYGGYKVEGYNLDQCTSGVLDMPSSNNLLAKCPCIATVLEKIYIFMTLENNMLAFTHFLRALSLHIELSCSSTNYVDEEKNLPPTFKIKNTIF
jgi:hypothetical protein